MFVWNSLIALFLSTVLEKKCGTPDQITNGYYDMSGGIEFGATITAHCKEGSVFLFINACLC